MVESQASRRGFLKAATLAIGGVIGAAVAVPLTRYFLFPVGRRIVADASLPIEVMSEEALRPGAAPMRVELVVDNVRDAWSVADQKPLGAAWVRKQEDGTIVALSSACPHLGCAVAFDEGESVFKCPCHKSAFAMSGEKLSGPSKRGLDPLPVIVEDGRVKITYLRFRPDVPEREPA